MIKKVKIVTCFFWI